MNPNLLKQELQAGQAVFGVMVGELRTPRLGMLLDAAGADFAIIDQEHGVYGPELLAGVLAGFRGGRCAPLVRVPAVAREYFAVALDQGASGVVVPGVETAEQLRQCVDLAKYPPQGSRGVCSLRAHGEFRRHDQAEFLRRANAETLLIAQIETAPALAKLEEILAVPGLDGILVGCADLSASLGVPNRPNQPELAQAIVQVIAAGKKLGVATGIHVYDPQQAGRYLAAGMRFLSVHTDVKALLDAWEQRLADVRGVWSRESGAGA